MSMTTLAVEYLKNQQEVNYSMASDLQHMAFEGMSYFYTDTPSIGMMRDLRVASWDTPEWLDGLLETYGIDGTYEMLFESSLYYAQQCYKEYEGGYYD